MTILTLFLYVGLVALAITYLISKKQDGGVNYLDSFLQNFVGSLLIFSGFVKAVDPMGTAYKMEQYFTAFEETAKGSFLKFMAPVFPFLSNYSISFSVFMIVFEIVLGIMLIIGYQRKLSAWLYLILMVFFTLLTGFTYLTGYVPSDVNFFEFSKWTPFVASNMRVTDCGCFGDFLKLEPKVSFMKDLVLMLPAVWFILRWRKLHELFSPSIRMAITFLSIFGLTLFSLSNFVWNEPVIDFRPFQNGVNIKNKLDEERKALAEVEIIAYRLRNRETKKEIEVPYKAYLDSFKLNPKFKETWETLDQVKSEPKIPRTKISDFDILNSEGESYTDHLLSDSSFHFIILSPKVKNHVRSVDEERIDTLYKMDTTVVKLKNKDSIVVSLVNAGTQKKLIKRNVYDWDSEFVNIVKNKMIPLIEGVRGPNVKASLIVGGLTEEGIRNLKIECKIDYPSYEADDLLIKTIMRSNPGLLLMKNGQILHKWHHKQLPTVEELRMKYLEDPSGKIY